MLQPTGTRATMKSDKDSILKALREQLTEAEKFLTGQTSYADQRAYGSCGDTTRQDAYAYMSQQATEVETRANDSVRILHEERIEMLSAADDLFALYFPADFDGPTTSKFWASLKWLLNVSLN